LNFGISRTAECCSVIRGRVRK